MSSILGDETRRATLQTNLTRDNVFKLSGLPLLRHFSQGFHGAAIRSEQLDVWGADVGEAAYCWFFAETPYNRHAEHVNSNL